MRRLLTLPGRALRTAWQFADPPLKIGRVPFGRAVLLMQVVAALTFLGYTMAKKDVRLPLVSSSPYELDVLLPDAKGLLPAKEPAVGVAGAPAGRVTRVRVEGGRARVTMRLDGDLEGKVFRDASAFVRPTSVLQTLIVNIDPGTPSAGPLEDGATIPAARTGTFVHIDELTETLDADTQAQVQVLVRELAGALEGREPQLRRIVGELGRLTDNARPLARALDDRRRLLVRLTDHLDAVFGTVGDRGAQLARAVELGRRTLGVTARRAPELEEATRRLAPALTETGRALAATRRLAAPLSPALERLVPVAGRVGPTARRLRATLPQLDRFVTQAARLTADGRRPARLLAKGLSRQTRLLENDQQPALRELLGLVDLLHKNRNGVLQFARNISGATSVNRQAGAFGQFDILNMEATPEGFGFSGAAARAATRRRGGDPSRLARMLAEMLERTCRDNAAACLLRFGVPGMPPEPLLAARPRTRRAR
ncbi:MAG TPA: MlaD family protein [Baekduia sp.]|nr:MlaD family protein [Baekduia sp.]